MKDKIKELALKVWATKKGKAFVIVFAIGVVLSVINLLR